MILTLTPNPSLDRTVSLPGPLQRGTVQRLTGVVMEPGGKGVNVARVLSNSGRAATAVLPADRGLTIITNSVLTAASLAAAGHTRVRILGGQLRGLTQAAVGPEALETLSALRVDVALLGANGVSAAHGMSTPDPDEATVKRAMVRSARQVVALVDSTKIGQEHLVSFASLDDIDLLVTDVELPPALIDQLTTTETEVLVA